MSDTPSKPKSQTQAELRAARLQAALRENLRRRKAAGVTPEDNHENAKQNDGEK